MARIKRESSEKKRSFVKWYLEHGFSIIPCKEKSKEAFIKWEEYQQRKMREDELTVYFEATTHNIAIVCGAISGNLVVIDIDNDNKKGKILHTLFGGDIEDKTFVVKTARGFHVYFQTDYPVKSFKLAGEEIAIDVKGEGGYVLAPPSIHPSGAVYEPKLFLPDHKIAFWHGDLRQDLIELIKEKFDETLSKEEYSINDLLAGVGEGNRNNAAIIIASYYRRRKLTKEEGWEQLKLWNERNKSPLTLEELKTTLNSAYDREQPYNYRFAKGVMDKEFYEKEEYEAAEKLLLEQNILEWIEKEALQDVVGHRKQKVSLFLLNLVCESVHVQGDTSTGKSYTTDRVFDCFPKNTWFKITGVTDKAIRYLAEEIKHLYLAEWKAVGGKQGEESTAQFDIKLVISEGKLSILVVERDEETGKLKTRLIETQIENIISTTTDTEIPTELLNRVWEITTDKGLTPSVVQRQIEQIGKLPPERICQPARKRRKILRCAIETLIKDSPKEYVIPFASELLPLFEKLWLNPRAARDTEKLFTLIYASAFLHSKSRPIVLAADKPVLVCLPQDLLNAWEYGDDAIIGTFTGETQRYKEMKEAVKQIAEKREEFNSELLAMFIGPTCSVVTARRWLARMENDKFVMEVEGKRQRNKRLYKLAGKEETSVEVELSIQKMEKLTEQFLNAQTLIQKCRIKKSEQDFLKVTLPLIVCTFGTLPPEEEKPEIHEGSWPQ